MFDHTKFGPRFAELLAGERLINALGPGKPNQDAEPPLRALTIESAFAGETIVDSDMARACLAGIWLYHDFLDESHKISQELHTTTGSYWHGIMHRREQDSENAKYWFRRVGSHPVFGKLGEALHRLVWPKTVLPELCFLGEGTWDPLRFVDLCESCRDRGDELELLCRRIQSFEWQQLFEHSYQHAVKDSAST